VLALTLSMIGLGGRISAAADNGIALNFKDADIDSVVGAFGHMLNRTFIIDPRVRGKITLETPKPVSREQAYQLLQSTLRMQGFAIVDNGGVAKVVPEADAKLQSGPVGAGRPAKGGDQVVTQIFRLQFESATNLVPVLRPLISPNNTITAYPNNNSLVVTDYAANLQRIARIVASLDSPSSNEVEVVAIKHAVASDIAVLVSRMIDDQSRAAAGAAVDPGQRVQLMADPRINSVMIRAGSPARLSLAKMLIMRLDQPAATPGNIHVVYLRNAEAVRLAQVLRGVLTGSDAAGAANALTGTATGMGLNPQGQNPQQALGPGGQPNSAANAPLQSGSTSTAGLTVNAGGAIIAADPATNSLIITAPEPLYRNLRAVIDRLDARRAQVFIESLIVEISVDRAAELGIQWQALKNVGDGTGTAIIGGTNLTTRGSGSNILDAATNIGSLGTGLNLGVVRGAVTINGTTLLNLGLLARALESDANANVLATPNLLTLDNEEARIIIGQNVPFVTGQFTLPGAGGGTVNPFQTVERKDVGTTLRVKPQVSEAGTVKMQIFQEVSSVQDKTLSAGLITNRRAIESNVLVDDGQIVVLGGLIEERVDGGAQKVPGLGDIPVLGQLFRYDTRKRTKTNLLVFLRPIVVRDAKDAYGVTADRYDYIRQLQGDSRLPQHWALPNYTSGQLPPMPAPPSPAKRSADGKDEDGTTREGREGMRPSGSAEGAARSGPDSMSPDIDRNARSAPIYRSSPTMLQTAPNEVLVPLNRPVDIRPLNDPGDAGSGGGTAVPPVEPQGGPGRIVGG
jgi:general secretion pathway protein D